MNRITDSIGKRLRASFFCMMLLAAVAGGLCPPAYAKAPKSRPATARNTGKSMKTSFEKPDFAFPQSVERDASAALDKALKTGNAVDALRAAVQLDVSRGLVSADSYAASVALFDSLASVLPKPYGALGRLLEARVYGEIYQSRAWEFDRRQIPATPVPADVMAWDRGMFADRIESLVREATGETSLASLPLADIRPLLVNADDAVKAGMSALDFATIQGVSLLEPFIARGTTARLPFGDAAQKAAATPAGLVDSMLRAAIERHRGDADKFTLSYLCDTMLGTLTGRAREAWLQRCLADFGDTPYCAPFLMAYCAEAEAEEPVKNGGSDPSAALASRNADKRKKYELLADYRKRFPNAYRIGEIEELLASMSRRHVTVNFPDQLLPSAKGNIVVEGGNLYDFHVLVFKLPGNDSEKDYDYGDVRTKGRLVKAVPVKIAASTPDSFSEKIEIDGLAPGIYAFVPSTGPTAAGIIMKSERTNVSTALVSDLTYIVSQPGRGKTRSLYITSALDGKPQAGAKITLWPVNGARRGNPKTETADAAGKISVSAGHWHFLAEAGGNYVAGELYRNYEGNRQTREELRGNILPDLSIYRPGDRTQFAVVAYTAKDKNLRPAADRALRVWLRDANGQKVDSTDVRTDASGRADGALTIPEAGLLGGWSIEARADDKWVASAGIAVAEYKSPSFQVTLDSSTGSHKAGETFVFKGKAMTYSGLPVQGGKVAYTVRFRPLWWRSAADNAEYGGETVTGADGSFSIQLPTDGVKDTPYARGGYVLDVTVTDAAGETQQAPALTFSLGSALHIVSDIPSIVEALPGSDFKVTVYDMTGHPVNRTIYYDITSAKGVSVAKGSFDSPKFTPDFKSIPSGRYAFRFSIDPGFKAGDTCDVACDSVTVWRADDKVPPVATPLWVPRTTLNLSAGAKTLTIPVGSSYRDSWVLAQISDSGEYSRDEWLKVSEGFATLRLDAPADDRRLYVELAGIRDLDRVNRTVTVIPHCQTERLKIEAVTFRDRIEPGANESWSFRFTVDGRRQTGLPVMAVMTDKALNALEPFRWSLNPYGTLYWSRVAQLNCRPVYSTGNSAWMQTKTVKTDDFRFRDPEWNTYGYPLYGGGYFYSQTRMFKNSLRIRGTGAAAPEAAPEEEHDTVYVTSGSVTNEAKDSAADMAAPKMDAQEEAADEEDGGNGAASLDDVPLRQVECPLAFFKPSLVTDGEGVTTIDFTAPAFTGTWQLQVAGYTPDMKGDVLTLDAVSAKKVMAQLNAPRFVRVSDVVSVAATLFNNSAETALVSGRIEITDALTGRNILSEDFQAADVPASGSRTVMSEFTVPSGIDAIAIRAYALVPGHSDGEQAVIPVLPSSTPVTESTPFYVAPGQDSFSVKLPKFEKDSQVTLTYCDNPVWECVTALPSIIQPESVNILSQAEALYGNAVAAHLFGRYPQLVDGVKAMAADSTLISPLDRNPELKTVLLNNTPWVNDASSETARMQDLVRYTDTDASLKAIEAIMKTLDDRQLSDGGWSWCPDMKSSTFITESVLSRLASLKDMDCLPAGGDKMAAKAFGYVDDALAEEWTRSKRKYFSTTELLNYLYTKSSFKGIGATSSFQALDKAAIKAISSDWRDFSVRDKATAAILLDRRGMAREARVILESLRQFASVSAEKGMWFDNLTSRYGSDNTLLTTARVLQAYAALEPQNQAVDQLRQWMVISKQTQNWGDNRATAGAIDAILTSGTDWTPAAQAPVVTLGGKTLTIGRTDAVTGRFTLDLDTKAASGKTLTVTRSGAGPAWGGVVAQYVAPITDVKAVSTPQLSITKAVYALTPGATGTTATATGLKTGGRVRVTLTITCDRDLEYVAVTDPRAACLEPADQISGYTGSDGTWFYREVRDSSTNLFIPYLSKGTHVISYECFVDREGDYTLGVAQAQSQYAPEITAHSAGTRIPVK